MINRDGESFAAQVKVLGPFVKESQSFGVVDFIGEHILQHTTSFCSVLNFGKASEDLDSESASLC